MRTAGEVVEDYRHATNTERRTHRSTEPLRNALVVELVNAGYPNLGAALHAWHLAVIGRPLFDQDSPDNTRARVSRLIDTLDRGGATPITTRTPERSAAA